MDDNKLLELLSNMGKQLETVISAQDRLEKRMDASIQKIERLEQGQENLTTQIVKVQITQENITNRDIKLLMESQSGTTEKVKLLDQMNENLEAVQSDVQVIKSVVTQHTSNITDLQNELKAVK